MRSSRRMESPRSEPFVRVCTSLSRAKGTGRMYFTVDGYPWMMTLSRSKVQPNFTAVSK